MSGTAKRIAAGMLGVGQSKVWMDPAKKKEIGEALTRDDIRKLIKDGSIKALPRRGVSRYRARKKQEGRRKGRRKGMGSRKGTYKARSGDKSKWIARVRLQRKTLQKLKMENKIEKTAARKVYMMVKGGYFRGKAALMTYLKENKFIKG